MQSCESAFKAFGAQQFAEWSGLPPGCKLPQLTAVFPLLNEGVGTGRIGEREAQYRMIKISGYPHAVRAWCAGESLLMLDAEYPDQTHTLATEIEKLGQPEARLDCWWDVLRLEKAEWLWASRGLAAIVNPDNLIVLRVFAFPTTSLAEYERAFRVSWRSIEFRER